MSANFDFSTVIQVGQEQGLNRFQLEQVLGSAIRLRHLDKKELVEVDVNITRETIVARKRVGKGRQGDWREVQPEMPSKSEFMDALELLQWADGAPGRVLEAVVAGYRDGGIMYRAAEQMVIVPENLLSSEDLYNRPAPGTQQLVVLCGGVDEQSKLRRCTRRGKDFVEAVIELYLPGSTSGVWMGASNSWALIRMEKKFMDDWLEKGGINVKHLQNVLGVRRITLVPQGQSNDPIDRQNYEIKHFVNNSWRACRIHRLEDELVEIEAPKDQKDDRKLRTFVAMFKKFVPNRELIIR